MADSVPWSDETEAQFRVAERAALEIARLYQPAGFAVTIDHCRNPPRLDKVVAEARLAVVKVLLMPDLQTNLRRSHERTNKSFDPHLLDETIAWTNEHYRIAPGNDWTVIDNTSLSVQATVDLLLQE